MILALVVLVWGALLGLSTWVPLSAGQSPRRAMVETPLFLSLLAAPLALAVWSWTRDRWLGACAGYAVGRALIPASAGGLQAAMWITAGIAGLLVLRDAPERALRLLPWLLVAAGLIQVAVALPQAFGWDPLYPGADRVHGTFESSKILAGALALIAAASPWWGAALFGGAVVGLHAFLPAVALGAALVWRFRASWRLGVAVPAAVVGVMATLLMRGASTDSTAQRLLVWGLAARDWATSWSSIFLGHGFGTWSERIPPLQLAAQPGSGDVYLWSYSEPVQLLYEGGLVAVVLVATWLWTHRAMFAGLAGAPVVALGIISLGQFPLHLPSSAGLAVIVLGAALRPRETAPCR